MDELCHVIVRDLPLVGQVFSLMPFAHLSLLHSMRGHAVIAVATALVA